MTPEQRIPAYLARLGLMASDIDVVFIGHLHFDHVGGICDLPGCEVHVHADELAAARADGGVFADEWAGSDAWQVQTAEYTLAPGVHAIASPGHTAGHMSLLIELPKGPPVILCGDAADLVENLAEEIAPGYCWQENEAQALASIRKLKALAQETGAQLWPNHDIDFFRGLLPFPAWRE